MVIQYFKPISLFKTYVNNIFLRTFLIANFTTRLILFFWAYQEGLLDLGLIFPIIYGGIVGDIVTSFFWLPIILTFQQSNFFRVFGHLLFSLIVVFTFISQLVFWDEFHTNFNFIAVDYLVYTHEIWGTLKESLPIYPIIVAIFLIAASITSITLKYSITKPSKILIFIMIICATTIGKIYDSKHFGPKNNNYAHEISKNGYYEFLSAFFNNGLNYTKFYPMINSSKALERVKQDLQQENSKYLKDENLARNINNTGSFKRKNVVVVVVESLSARFMTHFGNNENITPNLDKLAKEGLFFTNIYATGTRTVRGLEAVTLSVPPMPGTSVIKRPNNGDLFTIGVPFKKNNYVTDFIYGGYSYFDNQEKFFTLNNFAITDRSDLASDEISFSNIWGVADEDIFNKSIQKFDSHYKQDKNFFSIIMTTSNHRPYNFPEGRIDRLSGGGRAAAVKYTDYAIGKFIEDAKQKPWFEETIFVITADHCASSAGKTNLPVNKYHIPLIIYAPDFIKKGINAKLGSQIDIGPTILSLLNLSYTSKFYGQDLIKHNPNRAFISTYQLLGLLEDNNLVILSPNNAPSTFKIENHKQILVENNQSLAQKAISYYQSTYELFYGEQMKNDYK